MAARGLHNTTRAARGKVAGASLACPSSHVHCDFLEAAKPLVGFLETRRRCFFPLVSSPEIRILLIEGGNLAGTTYQHAPSHLARPLSESHLHVASLRNPPILAPPRLPRPPPTLFFLDSLLLYRAGSASGSTRDTHN